MYKTKICRVCKQIFQPKSSRQLDCNQPVTRICQVCGKEYIGKCSQNDLSKTCSIECQNKLASQGRQNSYSNQTRICELCGQEFHPRTNTQKVCERKHTLVCQVCGKEFELNYKSSAGQVDLRKTCSNECLRELHSIRNEERDNSLVQASYKETCLKKYGVEYPSQNPEIFAKQIATMKNKYGVEYFAQSSLYRSLAESTNLEKYGTAWPIQNQDILLKREQTNIERYGTANPMQNPEVVEKLKQTYIDKTGYSNPMQNPEVRRKSQQTLLEKYGVEYYSQTDEFKEKFKATSLKRYGTENPSQNADVRNKAKQTCLERYGSENFLSSEQGSKYASSKFRSKYNVKRYSQTQDWKENTMVKCNNIEEWMKFAVDPESYILSHYSDKPTYRKLAADLGVYASTVNDLIIRKGLRHLVSISISYMEEELTEFLTELNVDYILHDRNMIKPYELDIFIPQYKLGIECNPTATHNSSVHYKGMSEIELTRPKYHKMKTDMCEKTGISLFHIFGYDWEHSREIIKSMIRNKLSKCTDVIYARKCKVVEVLGSDSIAFLNSNHRQGAANSPIRLGLEYEGQLVSLMTFGKMRGTIGTGNEDLADCYELVRFCSLLNTSVIGGASKLFKHFIREYNPKQIRSFSDRAHTSGKLYPTLGFKEIRRSDPGYVWVDVVTDKAYHRANAQKKNIKKFLKDDSIDLSKTETEIMIEHGFVQVFDSGTITWEWTSS